MSRRLTIQEFIEKAQRVHGGKYDYSRTIYVDSRTKVAIVCPEHGEFEQLASSHLSGNGCPCCARVWSDEHKQNLRESSRKSRGMTTEEWIEKAKAVHGDKYDYSQTIYVNQRTNVKIVCPIHGVFEQKADSHIRGYGCRLCGLESDNHRGVHSWSDEQRERTAKTCMERYGARRYLDSAVGKEQIVRIKSSSEYRSKVSGIIASDTVQEKTKVTCLSRYGVEFPMKLSEVVDRVAESKRQNGTWSTSKPEEDMYIILCNRFGADDIVRQYKESRYPFHCDFYVKSLDLFIELNATWLHGGHWFDSTDKHDLQVLHEWQQYAESGKEFYGVAVDVWTVRDLKKRNVAITNNLNYVAFWNNDLSDFMQWIESDVLVLNNISK